jgi:hypothetical protein
MRDMLYCFVAPTLNRHSAQVGAVTRDDPTMFGGTYFSQNHLELRGLGREISINFDFGKPCAQQITYREAVEPGRTTWYSTRSDGSESEPTPRNRAPTSHQPALRDSPSVIGSPQSSLAQRLPIPRYSHPELRHLS